MQLQGTVNLAANPAPPIKRAANVGGAAMVVHLGLQLYSVRKFPPLESQLEIVARHGFTHVETFGPQHEDATRTRKLLESFGLKAASAHFNLEGIENEPERTLDAGCALHVRSGFCSVPWPSRCAEAQPLA